MMSLTKDSLLQEPDSALMFLMGKNQNMHLKAGGGGLLLLVAVSS